MGRRGAPAAAEMKMKVGMVAVEEVRARVIAVCFYQHGIRFEVLILSSCLP